MRLPPPTSPITLPGPGQVATLVIDNSEPPAPIWDEKAMLALLPARARRQGLALRDALLEAWGTMADAVWASISRTFGAQQGASNAGGRDLDDVWGEVTLRARIAGESDADYRARLLTPFDAVSPAAIKSIAAQLLARYFPLEPLVYIEPAADFAWVGSTSGGSLSYVQPQNQKLWADGERPNAGGYVISADLIPEFWIIIPAPAGSDDLSPFVGTPTDADAFIGSLSITPVYVAQVDPPLLVELLTEIEARRGGGVVWRLIVDPTLLSTA